MCKKGDVEIKEDMEIKNFKISPHLFPLPIPLLTQSKKRKQEDLWQ
jgi:hypothetical protein